MGRSRVRRIAVSGVMFAATVFGGALQAPGVASAGGCNIPYYSGHKAYMSCSGSGYAYMTIRCSAFGFWLGGGDRTWTTGKYISKSTVLVHDCGWGQWPKETKGFTPSI